MSLLFCLIVLIHGTRTVTNEPAYWVLLACCWESTSVTRTAGNRRRSQLTSPTILTAATLTQRITAAHQVGLHSDVRQTPANDDPGLPALRRRHSSDVSKQKFGTMPLVPIRGDEGNSSVLSANQALRKRHDRRTLSMYFPMEVQQDSLEECSESPDLPEPLYADFGLQVLKSLETSFLSSSIAETQEVPDHPPTHLPWRPDIWITSSSRKRSGWREAPWRLWSRAAGAGGGDGSSAAGSPDSDAAGQPAARRRQTLQGVCTPLQELSSAFIKKTMKEEQEEEKRPYDV